NFLNTGQIRRDVVVSVAAERNAGADQGTLERAARRHANPPTIQRRAAPAAGSKFFALNWIKNDSVLQLTFEFAADRDRKVGDAVNKVSRAIQRINDPFVVRILALLDAAFFTADGVIRVGLTEMVNDFFFSSLVDFGNKVVATFGFDGE